MSQLSQVEDVAEPAQDRPSLQRTAVRRREHESGGQQRSSLGELTLAVLGQRMAARITSAGQR
jgi:hypothetical protein